MRKLVLMVLGALAALGLALAPAASASNYGAWDDHDAYALIMEMRDDGYTGTVDYARHMALTICDWRAKGFSQSALSDGYVPGWLGHQPPTPDNPDDLAIATVYDSETHFCSSYFVPPWVS